VSPGRKTDMADAAWLAELLERAVAQFVRAAAGDPRAA
jgi:hypothetical protein